LPLYRKVCIPDGSNVLLSFFINSSFNFIKKI
jgi:hypothetical protein